MNSIIEFEIIYGRGWYQFMCDPKDSNRPATIKSLEDRVIPLNERWQWWWFSHLIASAGDIFSVEQLKQKWKALTDDDEAFTNGNGSSTKADYINGANLSVSPMAEQTLTTQGNIGLCIGDAIRANGEIWLPFLALDGTKPPPPIRWANHQHLIHTATIWYTDTLPDGTHRIGPFPQLGGRDVLFPFISKGGVNYVAARNCVKISGPPFPSPYVPPR